MGTDADNAEPEALLDRPSGPGGGGMGMVSDRFKSNDEFEEPDSLSVLLLPSSSSAVSWYCLLRYDVRLFASPFFLLPRLP